MKYQVGDKVQVKDLKGTDSNVCPSFYGRTGTITDIHCHFEETLYSVVLHRRGQECAFFEGELQDIEHKPA